MTQQMEFDFSNRGYRRSLIQQYKCPDVTIVEGNRKPVRRHVKAKDIKGLMRAMEDFGAYCYASQEAIAASAGMTVSDVRRALKALRMLGLLAEIRRPRGIEYRLVYNDIRIANEISDRPTGGSITPADSAAVIDPLIVPLIGPLGACDRPTDRPTSGSTNREQEPKNTLTPPKSPSAVTLAAPRSPRDATGEVVGAFVNLGIGLSKASTLVAQAIERGCSPRHLVALTRWWQRSQRRHPHRWRQPDVVLMLRLKDATPHVAAWKGWIPGEPMPRVRSRPAASFREQQEQARRAWAGSIAEELRARTAQQT